MSSNDLIELQREVGQRLLSRLEYITLAPLTIINMSADLSCKDEMENRYSQADLSNIDCQSADALVQTNDDSVDLIFANFLLHDFPVAEVLLAQWQRVLKPEGLLMFSCLGLPYFHDMHDIGDMMQKSGFKDSVVDMETISLQFKDPAKLKHYSVALNIEPQNNILSCEIVYGHAWGNVNSNDDEFCVPINKISIRTGE